MECKGMHAASMGIREGGVLVFAVEVPVKRVIVSNRDSCVSCVVERIYSACVCVCCEPLCARH